LTSAKDAVGQSLTWSAPDIQAGTMRPPAASEIIGVVPDFAIDAVHKAVPPIVYYVDPDFQGIISVRIDGRRAPETLAAIDKLWKQVGSPRPIRRSFLDQRITALYADITRQELLLAVFSSVAISIAILGLFGMSASMSELRTKEIGVRKAMGASRGDVVRLLLWQFTRPVMLANLIAWPLGYILMQRWLNGFAQHIPLAPWLFLAPSGIGAAIAALTVWRHAFVVAGTKPVAALRYE
jgi:putative ABC transport system permease protein